MRNVIPSLQVVTPLPASEADQLRPIVVSPGVAVSVPSAGS